MAPPYRLLFTPEAARKVANLQEQPGLERQHRAVLKTLGFLETNPRHPSLQTHKHLRLSRLRGKEVFEAYAQHKTPAAYRVFFEDGPGKEEITIIAITPHP